MSDEKVSAPVRQWLVEPPPREVAQSIARMARLDDVAHVAVMPDVHLASEVCVGLAIATRQLIYPAAVGSDIGCGMAAIGFDTSAELLADEDHAAALMAGLYRVVPAIKHPATSRSEELPSALNAAPLSDLRLEKLKRRDGCWQLGTLGRGNHFIEFQSDANDRLWLMVHSGSRGIGQAIAKHHLAIASGHDQRERLVALEADSDAGQAYLADAAWAARYAADNRIGMIRAIERLVSELFGVAMITDSLIHADHNHARRETHFGEPFWVHRKGAQSATAGEFGVIPGSMGAESFHVSGRGHAESLASSSHGAGRALSRTEAAQAVTSHRLQREMQGVWFDQRHSGRLRDEAPSAYKNIQAVMRAQRELVRIERKLTPLLSYKGV